MTPPPLDDLRDYYERELRFLRRMGAEFARDHPEVADRLALYERESADPHVERLLESFAFLTARIQRNLDAELPEVTSGLLHALYPQMVDPIPSMSVARFRLGGSEGKVTTGYPVPAGTPLFHEASSGEVCRFRTCYPTVLWPVDVSAVAIEPIRGDESDRFAATGLSKIRVRLRATAGTLGDLGPALHTLRFYLNGELSTTAALYELLMDAVVEAWVCPVGPDGNPKAPVDWFRLGEDALRPVGFAADEAMLPYPAHAMAGYRLIQQYFAFPRAYLFVDVAGLEIPDGAEADLVFVLGVAKPKGLALERENLVLGCTPIINLFDKVSEPIRIDHRHYEYRLVGDARAEEVTEIHSIRRVTGSSDVSREAYSIEPLYSFRHGTAEADTPYWHARRVPTDRRDLRGTDIYLSFMNLDSSAHRLDPTTVYAHTVCTNRGLAPRLPGSFPLGLEEGGPLKDIVGLHRPSEPLYPDQGGAERWRLVSQLTLNHLSLAGAQGLDALREILELYADPSRPSNATEIKGITRVEVDEHVHRMGSDAWRGFVRGFRVTVQLDERAFPAGNAFLFANVLRHFFGLYASVNSFVQFRLEGKIREGIWKTWPPLTGFRTLI